MILSVGGDYREQRLPTFQRKQEAAALLSSWDSVRASTALCCLQLHQWHRRQLGLTGCAPGFLHFTAFHLLVHISLKLRQKPEQVKLLKYLGFIFCFKLMLLPSTSRVRVQIRRRCLYIQVLHPVVSSCGRLTVLNVLVWNWQNSKALRGGGGRETCSHATGVDISPTAGFLLHIIKEAVELHCWDSGP